MNKIQQVLQECEEHFDGFFLNNGVDGLLEDNFQDPKMLIVKRNFQQSQKKLIDAVIEVLDGKEILSEHISENEVINREFGQLSPENIGYNDALRNIKQLLKDSL